MYRSYAFAPTMLLAAGTVAGSAHAALIVQQYDMVATADAQTVSIGDQGDTQYGFGLNDDGSAWFGWASPNLEAARPFALSSSSISTFYSGALILNPLSDGGVFTTAAMPGADAVASYCAAVTPLASGDSYAQLKFDIGSDHYLGVAHFLGDPGSDGGNGGGGHGPHLNAVARDPSITLVDITYGSADATGAVPEPATWAEMILGMGAVGVGMRAARRRKAQAANA